MTKEFCDLCAVSLNPLQKHKFFFEIMDMNRKYPPVLGLAGDVCSQCATFLKKRITHLLKGLAT